nr:HAMP domain-containing histidine kinase [Lachnospiraceae bacterium]
MTNKLQYRFIAITSFAITLVMIVLLALLNIYNYGATYREAYKVLRYIASRGGELGEVDIRVSMNAISESEKEPESETFFRVDATEVGNLLAFVLGEGRELDLTGENSYKIRYYSVLLDKDGNVLEINKRHIASLKEEEMIETAKELESKVGSKGHFMDGALTYTYLVKKTSDHGRLVIVMDSTNEIKDATDVIRRSFLFGVLCLIVFVIVMVFLSKQAIIPVIRNMENQKAFITNAGHELKTPLAVIKADTEIIEMTNGESEWTASINNQVDRLTVLIGNLITLAKMGELDKEELSDVDFSECVMTSLGNYKAVIEHQGKSVTSEITENIHVLGTKDGLTEIVNILLDNAQKYCDDNGSIGVELTSAKKNSGARLVVSN